MMNPVSGVTTHFSSEANQFTHQPGMRFTEGIDGIVRWYVSAGITGNVERPAAELMMVGWVFAGAGDWN